MKSRMPDSHNLRGQPLGLVGAGLGEKMVDATERAA
jgi:hypothetical protein